MCSRDVLKRIAGWIQMNEVNAGCPWSRPSSETSYLTCARGLSAVHPVNGGACNAAGEWIQYPKLCDSEFAPSLKGIAHERGQLYVPTVWSLTAEDFQAVLDNLEIVRTAVDNLVILATTRAHDGPWDGVDFDIEGVDDSYKERLTAWLASATEALHAEGLTVNVTTVASDRDSGLPYNRHVYDFAALAEFVDTITVMCYTSFGMYPNTAPGPYDLVDHVLAYVLSKGVKSSQLFAGLSIASRYVEYAEGLSEWPTRLVYTSHANAQTILASAGIGAEWYETGDDGKLFRLKRAVWNDGIPKEMWVVDVDTLDAHLSLVDSYGVGGICLFVLGSEALGAWDATTRWMVRGRTGVQRRLAPITFSDLIGALYCERSLSR